MYHKTLGLTEFILEEERHAKNASGSFTHLLTQIEYASKIIASHIKKAGLVDILGKTGERNYYDDEVMKLDRFSNDILIDTLSLSGQVYAIGSEELLDFHFVEKHKGEYIVFMDPLDGSSNIESNVTVGTIFSIYHKSDNLLQPGIKQVAAGYVIYGTSVMFVYTTGNGVNGFTLDPSIGSFLLSHPTITIPKFGNIYSINEANYYLFSDKERAYIDSIKKNQEKTHFSARYVGSMVADVHRTLLKGGIFIYPTDTKNPNGKLRLMIEVNPLSFIITQAGGMAVSNGKNPLTLIPTTLHDRVPIALGSIENVQMYEEIMHEVH